jgi:hypothetical protein
MKKIIHRAENRGHKNFGWLDTYHSFSFGNYYDPQKVQFGMLRVLNDDVVKPEKGFGFHPHDNMEIISIPLEGSLNHKDTIGHEQVINVGDIQVMSAGTGILHSEFNNSTTEDVNFLQIWILPKKKNIEPVYNQHTYKEWDSYKEWNLLVSGDGKAPLQINQDAFISKIELQKDETSEYQMYANQNGSYLFVIEGEVDVNGITLRKRDAIGFNKTEKFEIKALQNAVVLNLEIPMNN